MRSPCPLASRWSQSVSSLGKQKRRCLPPPHTLAAARRGRRFLSLLPPASCLLPEPPPAHRRFHRPRRATAQCPLPSLPPVCPNCSAELSFALLSEHGPPRQGNQWSQQLPGSLAAGSAAAAAAAPVAAAAAVPPFGVPPATADALGVDPPFRVQCSECQWCTTATNQLQFELARRAHLPTCIGSLSRRLRTVEAELQQLRAGQATAGAVAAPLLPVAFHAGAGAAMPPHVPLQWQRQWRRQHLTRSTTRRMTTTLWRLTLPRIEDAKAKGYCCTFSFGLWPCSCRRGRESQD
jgi:hypothetical protein